MTNVDSENEFEILVVDNNSDISISWVQQDFPSVKLIQNPVNRGFAFACNQGVSMSKGEWVVFLNPDVDISAHAIKQLIEFAEKNNLDAVSPTPDNPNYKKPVPTPLTFLAEFTPLVRLMGPRFIGKITNRYTLFGGCLGIRRSVIHELGGWDERFFVWFEDVDLTKQLFDKNFKVGWANVEFKHEGGTSFAHLNTQLKRNLFFNEMAVYADKYFGPFGRMMVNFLRYRFHVTKFFPRLQEGVSITIPNMRKDVLDIFLKENEEYLKTIEHVVVVTSGLAMRDVWSYRAKYRYIRFIPIQKNKGFAHTVNTGFRASTTTWLGTVNDDVTLNESWITTCLKDLPDDAGSVNPVIYSENEKIESAGISILNKGKAHPIKQVPDDTYHRVDATNAAVVLYKNDALQETGLFDEKFGSYLEDIDLSLRLQKKGFYNYVCTKARVQHKGQVTSSGLGKKKQWHDFKNWIFVIVKNWPKSSLIAHFPSILVERLRNISGIIKS